MNNKKIITIALIALVFLIFFMVVDYYQKRWGTISPNILSITQPVTIFSGIVEKIEGNILTVSQKQTLAQNMEPPIPSPITRVSVVPSPIPTPKIITITYQVVVSDRTNLRQPVSIVNYLFKTPSLNPPKLTIKNVRVGQYITASSLVDLRTLNGNQFEAIVLNLPQKTNTLYGKIIRTEGNTVILKAMQPKVFTVTITQNTEISRMVYNLTLPKPEKLALSDLKEGMQVTIFTDEDVSARTQVTALRIEPAIPLAPAMLPPALSPTP